MSAAAASLLTGERPQALDGAEQSGEIMGREHGHGHPFRLQLLQGRHALGDAALDHQVGLQGQDHFDIGLEMGAHRGEISQGGIALDVSDNPVLKPQGNQDLRQAAVQ